MNRLPPGRGAPPPRQAPWSHGAVERVPCCHCGKPNDFRELQNQQLLDTGHRVDCGHCGRVMEVAAIRQVTVVAVRPWDSVAAAQRGAAQATTIGPGALQRLLKG